MEFSYSKNNNLLKVAWLPSSENMTEKDFREQTHVGREVFLKYRPQKILGQTQNLKYVISPDLQSWHNLMIMPVFSYLKLEKLAIVTSKNIFVNLSVNQLIEDDTEANYNTRYFKTEEEAKQWLMW